MQLIPSIDLRRGKVVRLEQGRDDRSTIYAGDPVEVLTRFQEAGAERVHIVDLDAAFGETRQCSVLARLLQSVKREKLQLGGGMRTESAIRDALDSGFDRVVVGSMAVREPARLARNSVDFPGRLIPALEFAGGALRVGGWRETSVLCLAEVLQELLPFTRHFPAVLVTDIAHDGMLTGPNLELAVSIARESGIPAIVSGGVASLADVAAAASLAEVSGLIVGRSYYEGRIDLRVAIDLARSRASAGVA